MEKGKKDQKRNSLGRGLNALLSESVDQDDTLSEIHPASNTGMSDGIEISSIESNPFQPRTHFDLVALQELSDSIKALGVIQPITVRKLSHDKFQLISGERRLEASKLAGLERIPAYIRVADDEQMLTMALVENIQRRDLNPIEVALGYKRLIEELKLVIEDVGEKVGLNRATVNNYLRLLKLPPEIQIGIRDQKISMGHARALITVDDPVLQIKLYQETIAQDYSVRRVEELVRTYQETKPDKKNTAKKPAKASSDQMHINEVQKRLENRFDTRVKINHHPEGKGEIKIDYFSVEDLNRILDLLEE